MSDIDPQLLGAVVSFLKEKCEIPNTVYSFEYEFNGSKFKVRSSIKSLDVDGLWGLASIEIIRISR
jgi:hypothetical protein